MSGESAVADIGPVELVVFDFDGVMTDNGVWVHQDGTESVRCDRSDGLGIGRLKQSGIPILVLSTERNPVVAARCTKLDIPVCHGISDKGAWLRHYLSDQKIDPLRVVYVGNDVNDADCLHFVGVPVVVADAHPSVRHLARFILSRNGGHGAVRELCDALVDGTPLALDPTTPTQSEEPR
jgi:YrbI family 3-deoxy-D-manno-octulosonate 8-phosphate phosphatase